MILTGSTPGSVRRWIKDLAGVTSTDWGHLYFQRGSRIDIMDDAGPSTCRPFVVTRYSLYYISHERTPHPRKYKTGFHLRADEQFLKDLDDLSANERPLTSRADYVRKLVPEATKQALRKKRSKVRHLNLIGAHGGTTSFACPTSPLASIAVCLTEILEPERLLLATTKDTPRCLLFRSLVQSSDFLNQRHSHAANEKKLASSGTPRPP
jgi:hypothetical protein